MKSRRFVNIQPSINEETREIGTAAVTLDVTLARAYGLSEKAIVRLWERMSTAARSELRLSHRKGRVRTCVCVDCDPKGTSYRRYMKANPV